LRALLTFVIHVKQYVSARYTSPAVVYPLCVGLW